MTGRRDDRPAITLRVSRDGGRTWSPKVTYRPGRWAPLDESPGRYPPCACARCLARPAARADAGDFDELLDKESYRR